MSGVKLIYVLLWTAVLVAAFYFLGMLAFAGVFDKKYSREELVKEFKDHENEFADLEACFVSNLPKNNPPMVSFGLKNWNKISLIIYPEVISPGNKIIGADNVKIGSPELDSALKLLGWTNETLKSLRDKLSKTNCDWIRNSDNRKVISIYPNQNGWGHFSYNIYDRPIVDSLISLYGKPIGNSDFGKRIVLSYSAAL